MAWSMDYINILSTDLNLFPILRGMYVNSTYTPR